MGSHHLEHHGEPAGQVRAPPLDDRDVIPDVTEPVRQVSAVVAEDKPTRRADRIAVVLGCMKVLDRPVGRSARTHARLRQRRIVRDGEDMPASGSEYAMDLAKAGVRVWDVLEDVLADDKVEALVLERQALDVLASDATGSDHPRLHAIEIR